VDLIIERTGEAPLVLQPLHAQDYATEASLLGWPPGSWRYTVLGTIAGHPVEFVKRAYDYTPDGDIAGALYTTRLGQYSLLVAND
jgi:hypothetical protein